jgi:hypothetical protein
MSGNSKILTGLMERRALEAAFSELIETTNPELLVQRAREIARYGVTAVPVMLAMLDTNDPQLRGGLGQVAANLDRSIVVPALRSAARARDRSDRARLSALTILDRYLHEPIDDDLLSDLQDPQTVAQESLRELLREMAGNPYAIVEYLMQLSEQPPDVPHMILDAVPSAAPGPHLTTLLRMLAQDPNRQLAHQAVEQLGRTRTAEAARALGSLITTLPGELAASAERGLRKLRMSGVRDDAPDPAVEPWFAQAKVWRVLLSPVDGAGAQMIWFICPPDEEGRSTLLSVVTQDPEGIVGCTELRAAPAAELPQHQTTGHVHRIVHRQGALPLAMLETSLETARDTVTAALARNWAGGRPTPLPYRLLNPLIWTTAAMPAVDPAAPTATTADSAPLGDLLDHPAFVGWHWWPTSQPWGGTVRDRSGLRAALLAALRHFGPDVRESYARRLQAMSRWLEQAGDEQAAALAQATAEEIITVPSETSRFVQHLVRAGFELTQLRYSRM